VRQFGGPPLGAKRSALPHDLRREPNCYETSKFVDCEYEAASGMHYLVYGDEITRKQVRRVESGTHWPYGLTGQETPAALKAKLQTRYGLRFRSDVSQLDGTILTASVPPDPDRCAIYFEFGRSSRLDQATLYCLTPED
jgi:hypothetical protein